jgi:hypothetical protein
VDDKEAVEFRNQGFLVQARIQKSGIDSIQLIPYRIRTTGLEILSGTSQQEFFNNLCQISKLLDSESLAAVWNAYADMWFERSFSSELRQFTQLMSWRELCGAVSDRFRYQARQITGLRRFFPRVLASIFYRMSQWLPGESGDASQSASIFRNRFDTLAHRELYQTTLKRIATGKNRDSSAWARSLLITWQVFD